MAALAARCDVFGGLECHIIESRERGAKSLALLGVDASSSRVVILDDSPSAWTAADQGMVLAAKRYDVKQLAETEDSDDDEALDAELGYMTKTRTELIGFFVPPVIDFTVDTPRKRGVVASSDSSPPAAKKARLSFADAAAAAAQEETQATVTAEQPAVDFVTAAAQDNIPAAAHPLSSKNGIGGGGREQQLLPQHISAGGSGEKSRPTVQHASLAARQEVPFLPGKASDHLQKKVPPPPFVAAPVAAAAAPGGASAPPFLKTHTSQLHDSGRGVGFSPAPPPRGSVGAPATSLGGRPTGFSAAAPGAKLSETTNNHARNGGFGPPQYRGDAVAAVPRKRAAPGSTPVLASLL